MFFRKMMAGLLAAASMGAMAVALTASGAAAATCTGKVRSDFNGDGIADVAIGEPQSGPGPGVVHVLYGTRSGLRADATAGTPDDQLITAPPQDRLSFFGSKIVALDYNGDGCSDLAVAAPQGTRPGGGTSGSGFVSVYFGSTGGLIPTGPLNLDGTVAGGHVPALGDEFGFSLAAGNFNGDAKQDLIIGAFAENQTNGAVYIVPGATSNGFRFVQGSDDVPAGESRDFFGLRVAAADFNGDGVDDLVASAPFLHQGAGGVVVMNGSGDAALLSSTGKLWTQDTTDSSGKGISGSSEPGDHFGDSLATGDFNGNGKADLAIGVPLEDLGTNADAGMVNVIYSGGTAGLSVTGNQGWSQDSAGISGAAEPSDEFGAALAAGDFNGNGRTDLAIGVFLEDLGSATNAGSVNVIMGSSTGLTSSGQQAWSQSSAGIAGTAEAGDGFGNSLAVGRTHSAGRDDLIVGVSEGIGDLLAAGAIHMIPGSATGLTATGSQAFNADTAGVQGTATRGGDFGAAIS